MKPPAKPHGYRHRFDFEMGTLVKSPCKGCEFRPDFPRCMATCRMLDMIHTALKDSVSCSRRK